MMKKLLAVSISLTLSASAFAADSVTRPVDFGVSDIAYRVSESNVYFLKHLEKAGVNEFAHQRDIVSVASQQVIRENQDILYSSSVVDVSEGATIAVPGYDAFSIIQIIDMQNYSLRTVYPGESVTLTPEDLSFGNYVYLNARTQPTSYDEAGLKAAHAQQDALIIKANASNAYEVPDNVLSEEKMIKVRNALIQDINEGKVKDYTTLMGKPDFVDPQGHLYVTAYGWGGLPVMDAGYMNLPVTSTNGECSSLTIEQPPLQFDKGGFWSVTTYDPDGWIARDKAAISNNEAVANTDGSYTVHFNCSGMDNNIDTPEQFTALLRAYAPNGLPEIAQYLENASRNYVVNPAINSGDWPVNPIEMGMTAEQYIRTELTAFMVNFAQRSGINNFSHFKELSTKDDTWVVSPNQDTIYSLATVNAKDGFTLELPDVGDRFISTQITNQDHYTPIYLYGGGTRTFTREELGGDIVAVGIRIGTDATPEDVEYIANTLQPQYQVISPAGSNVEAPELDLKTMMQVRNALLPYYTELDNTFGIMGKGYEEGQDEWRRILGVAGALGLSADENAMYAISGPENAKANACYKATFDKVPADAFFSLTAYNSDKFLMTNEKNSVSSNRPALVVNEDGGFTAYFGGPDCAQANHPNFILTPEDNWDTLLRAYKPNVADFKAYTTPTYKMIN